MEFRLSPVLDHQLEFGVNRVPDSVLGRRAGDELSSAVALLQDAILALGAGGGLPYGKPLEESESDNYQIALVPLENKTHRLGKNSQTGERKSVLVLPLTWRELMVRLHAGLSPDERRESSVVRFGEVFADFSSMEVTRARETVILTTLEFKLFKFLVQNAGRVISRDEMLNEVWGYENYPCTRTVDNHILRLRQKLESDPANPVHFRTVHGVGYKFVLEASRVAAETKM